MAPDSSPLAQGTRPIHRHLPKRGRFIPACPWSTRRRSSRDSGSSVHPRASGEHKPKISPYWHFDGSSPSARGTPSLTGSGRPNRRFTPACAGNTYRRPSCRCAPVVQPRPRREHQYLARYDGGAYGSSPSTRGQRRHQWLVLPHRRFIPQRGEHSARRSMTTISPGSSPPARGTHFRSRRIGRGHRFIPACAGNTLPRGSGGRWGSVHPRPRGEHAACTNRPSSIIGSSPLE